MGFIGKSISRKLIAVTLLIVIIIFSASGLISNYQVKEILVDEAKLMLMKDSQLVAEQINVFMDKNKYLVHAMSKNQRDGTQKIRKMAKSPLQSLMLMMSPAAWLSLLSNLYTIKGI